ncbi:four helix bundle protein [candidate division TA06 bacterium]|uniref:Four helix bundle protein n=1 Tax=candidate division TA06 bacterium TaxID=2250710 RepID=A0A933IAR5_UNCT6|nr:four helix bundle protein [candidate division TA06 bacterium]
MDESQVKKVKSFEPFNCLESRQRCTQICLPYRKSITRLRKNSLVSQIKRTVVSITANIAEGYGRYHQNIQYCRQSRGSLSLR